MSFKARNKGNLGDTGGAFRGLVNCSGLKLNQNLTIIITSMSFLKKTFAIFQHLTTMGCRLKHINDLPTSLSSPQADMAMSWMGHFSVLTL